MTTAEVKYLFIDSDEIVNKVGNDEVYVEVQQPIMIADESQGEYIDVELISFSCRNDFYQMNDSNNAFGIRSVGTTTTYTLQNGFPSVLSIDNELKADLETETGEIWNVTYSNYTGKITMSSTYTSGFPPSDLALDFTVANSAYKMLGFDSAVYEFNIVGATATLTAPHTVNLGSRIKALNVRTSLIEDNFEGSSDGIVSSDILGVIPVVVSPLNYIVFDPTTEAFRTHIGSHRVSSFTFRVTDETGILAGLNSGFQATLRFRRMREDNKENTGILREMLDLQQMKWLTKEDKKKRKQYNNFSMYNNELL